MKKSTYLIMACLFFVLSACKKPNPETEIIKKFESNPNLVTLKSGVVVEKFGNEYVWQGDIK